MFKFNKGMWLEGNPNNQPTDTTRINRNVVIRRGSGDIIPEPGFVLDDTGYYDSTLKTPIGEISLFDEDFIIFSVTAQNSSEIGISNRGVYTTLYNNIDLNFDKYKPIHGTATKNYKGERIIVFTDNVNPPRILNIDNLSNYSNANKMLLNPLTTQPYIDVELVNNVGTGLKTGAYYPICQYELSDLSATEWFLGYNPVFITNDLDVQRYNVYDGSISGLDSDKAMLLQISNINVDFNNLNIGYVQVKNGELFAYKTNTIKIEDVITVGKINTILTGDIIKETISLSEIQNIKAKFKNVKLMEQFQDELLLTGIKQYSEINQQKEVNKLNLICTSKLTKIIDNSDLFTGYKTHQFNNKMRTFAHGEVYAFYIQFQFQYGWGQWWTLVGDELTDADKVVGFEGFKKYQYDDTCSVLDTINNEVFMSFSKWENENETYPKDSNYPIGNVRHFKFPSLQYLRKNVHDTDIMGTTHQSILGIKLQTIDLSKFKDSQNNQALGYRIGYAKRSNINSSTLGQSIVVVNQYYDLNENIYDDSNVLKQRRLYCSAGGNYKYLPDPTPHLFVPLDGTSKTNLRTYPVELLVTKNSPVFNYVRKEYTIQSDDSELLHKNDQFEFTKVFDYTKGISSHISTQTKLFKVNDKKYIPNNVLLNTIDNLFQEEYLNVIIDDGANLMLFNSSTASITDAEYNVIITLLNIKGNYYSNFYEQEIVNCGEILRNADKTTYGGDTYICDMTVNTYGRFTAGTTNAADGTNGLNDGIRDRDNKYNGIRTAKRFMVSSMYNMNFKFVIDDKSKGYTDYYPVSNKDYLILMERDKNANDWINGYNRDFNVINNLEYASIYNPMIVKQTIFPYRIYRSERLSKSSLVNYWRTILSENYYDMPSNRGEPINVVSGQDYVYIHHEKALFKTRTRQKLQTTDGIDVQVGVGDIFEHIPIEVLHDFFGSLGTQHKYSCKLTNQGYIFCDAEKQKWFLVTSDSVLNLSNIENGTQLFFYNNTEVIGDNPYVNNGYTIGLDEKYDRIIITRKYKKIKDEFKSRYKGVYINTDAFINSLRSGDIVFKDNRFQQMQ